MRRSEREAREGLRLLALARRPPTDDEPPPQERDEAERQLTLLGLVTMFDPPRAGGCRRRSTSCHRPGSESIVITGDHPLTAAAIARHVGHRRRGEPDRVMARQDRHRHESELIELLSGDRELVFARATPEAKLQIAETLQATGMSSR